MEKSNKEPLATEDVIGDENSSGGNEVKIHWSEENETILVEWCDIAQCYKWLNYRSHTMYSRMHAWYTIPAIILSTISGTASFAQASIPLEYQTYAPMAIGTINILIGILSTIQQYLKISELNEAHRISSISWDKFARNIRIELAKTPEERIDAGSFIKMCRQEFDRLMETSPPIPDYIVNEFVRKFKGQTEEQQEMYKKLKKPDICDNTINTVNETRHKWYIEEKKRKEEEAARREKELSAPTLSKDNIKNEFGNALLRKLQDIRKKNIGTPNSDSKSDIDEDKKKKDDEDKKKKDEEDKKKREEELKKKVQEELQRKEEEEKKKKEDEELKKKEQEKQEQISKIEKYIENYEENYGRRPLKDEIEDNFMNDIKKKILDNFLNNYDNVSFKL